MKIKFLQINVSGPGETITHPNLFNSIIGSLGRPILDRPCVFIFVTYLAHRMKSCLEFCKNLHRPFAFQNIFYEWLITKNEINFVSYKDHNTRFVTTEDLEDVIKLLEKDSIKLFQCFSDNRMKTNHLNWHLLGIGKNCITINVSRFEMKNNKCKKVAWRSVANKGQLWSEVWKLFRCF